MNEFYPYITDEMQENDIQADSNSVLAEVNVPPAEIIELEDGFDYDGYQVVRREFFAHMNEPSLSFNNSKIYVNSACLNKFRSTDYVQVLVNRETKVLAIRPCDEGERDSFVWCKDTKGKRAPKQITCRIFYAMLADLLDWNPDYRYKLIGKIIHANGEYLIVFDLNSTEVYMRYTTEGGKPKSSRRPVFPESWKGQFGLPYKEHQKSLQVNIFDGYAVYGIKDESSETSGTGSLISNDAEAHTSEGG